MPTIYLYSNALPNLFVIFLSSKPTTHSQEELGNEAQNPHKQAFILTQRTTKIQFNNKTHTIIHLYGII
ncbi:hypothetical protein BGC33_02995 [Bathymodiolus thermophilus thioautotrophic gill symbiont]|uniref:Uncharacterized protein n=1 Tax=Bathymodiolus thermophilus thioautotrophic gill symbiont TaxID=2360 RepID=A0A1J5TTS3_9GAMM|nr:hypothetical protein BGC33_02995 [Bathymodiolus thermophilus thioautotrophic gill symbiont]